MDRIIAIDHFSEKDAAAVTADVSACRWWCVLLPCNVDEDEERALL